MYKVFLNDIQIVFDSDTSLKKKGIKTKHIYSKNYPKPEEVLDIISTAKKIEKIEIRGDGIEELWKTFCLDFTVIEAAGGAVFNSKSELLMIWRLETWDLPKGKIEKKETPTEAALREVCEETGVCNLKIISQLPDTYHVYHKNKKPFLKKTYWFKMKCRNFTGFKLQRKEGILDAKWMNKKAVLDNLKCSYPSISDLIRTSLVK